MSELVINLIQYVSVSGKACFDKDMKRKFSIFDFQFCSNAVYEMRLEDFVVIRSGRVSDDQLHQFEPKPTIHRSSLSS
jgi:hypothetical protein